MDIEMKYHNVYYYCNILSNMIEHMQAEIETLKQRLDIFNKSDKERIKKAFWEDDTYVLYRLQLRR